MKVAASLVTLIVALNTPVKKVPACHNSRNTAKSAEEDAKGLLSEGRICIGALYYDFQQPVDRNVACEQFYGFHL
jgi:hypothetical protein